MHQLKLAVSGAQILFVAFGALVLVPLLTGLNPAMALLGAGVGTLLFQLITKQQVPVFLGSSFAFIAPIIYANQTWGMGATMFGLFCAGFMYFIFALMIRFGGIEAVNKLLPPVVIGPVIMVIGLSVAMVACQMAMGQAGGEQVIDYQKSLLLAGFTFLVTMIVTVFAKGMMRLVPILIGVAAGYALALAMGLVDTAKLINAPLFAIPEFHTPEINWHAALFMLPVAIAGMAVKRAATAIITRLGYQPVLVGNTVLLGALIAGFALMTPEQPLGLRIAQMALFGAVNSFQFTAMNAVTLKDLAPERAASGNSLYSMVQMLGMSLGVTCAAALLAAFGDWLGAGHGAQTLPVFRATFVAIGVMTMGAAAIFWQLDRGTPARAAATAAVDET